MSTLHNCMQVCVCLCGHLCLHRAVCLYVDLHDYNKLQGVSRNNSAFVMSNWVNRYIAGIIGKEMEWETWMVVYSIGAVYIEETCN